MDNYCRILLFVLIGHALGLYSKRAQGEIGQGVRTRSLSRSPSRGQTPPFNSFTSFTYHCLSPSVLYLLLLLPLFSSSLPGAVEREGEREREKREREREERKRERLVPAQSRALSHTLALAGGARGYRGSAGRRGQSENKDVANQPSSSALPAPQDS